MPKTRIDKTDGLIRRKPRSKTELELFCIVTANEVKKGVIFKGKKIVEVLPWED
jgi:hypothetical protein